MDWTCEEVSRIRNIYVVEGPRCPFHGTRNANANVSYRAFGDPQGIYWTLALGVCGVFIDELDAYVIGSRTCPDYEQEEPLRCFLTQNYCVYATNQAQYTDQLWILDGAPAAMILRRVDLGYRLISSASTIPISKERSMRAIAEESIETDDQYQRILII